MKQKRFHHLYCPDCGAILTQLHGTGGNHDFWCKYCETFYILEDEKPFCSNDDVVIWGDELNSLIEYAHSIEIENKELMELLSQIHSDSNIKNQLIQLNLKLVFRCVQYECPAGCNNIADIVQSGCVGLLEAINTCEYMDYRSFQTHMKKCIHSRVRQAIQAIWNEISDPICSKQFFQQTWDRYYGIYGNQGTASDYERQIFIRQSAQQQRVAEQMISEYLPYIEPPVLFSNKHIEAAICNDSKYAENNTNDFVNNQVLSEMLYKLEYDALFHLEPIEAEILRMHYGMDIYRPMTFRECGDTLGISGERARQIELRALSKLRTYFKREIQELQ